MNYPVFLAIDLGAESGRALIGELKEGKLITAEIHRFPNSILKIKGHLHWDINYLFKQILESIQWATEKYKGRLISIGIDTWGVDYGLFDNSGKLIELPYCYRDHRTDHIMEEVFEIIPKEKIYHQTGIQFLQINTLFQLFAEMQQHPEILRQASKLLFIPDILNYFLTGIQKSEFTFVTTSQLYNLVKKCWDKDLLAAANIDSELFCDIAEPGTMLGNINRNLPHLQIPEIKVVHVASHDTASAVAAIPADGENWAYISSGTWSLVGIEIKQPFISNESLMHNFTNEGGFNGTYRFLKNVMGLWLIQQCFKTWNFAGYEQITPLLAECKNEKPFQSMIDPDWKGFFNPENMPDAIVRFCQITAQKQPENHGQFARSIFESLALRYRYVIEEIEYITGKTIERIHIISGGSKNDLLCEFTANATGRMVLSGPAEATAMGNLLVQALAVGSLKNPEEIRQIVAQSQNSKCFIPENTTEWDIAYFRFLEIISKKWYYD
jgi:rhamnulokinase